MRWRPLTWLLLSVLFFAAALYFWRLGDEWAAKKAAAPGALKPAVPPPATASSTSRMPGLKLPPGAPGPLEASSASTQNSGSKTPQFPYRLRNTTKTVGQLARGNDKAILLENALIDTAQSTRPLVPPHLRSEDDPGSYIVQSRTGLDDAFRALLKNAGASIIGYIPKDAYLVRASAAVAQSLQAQPQTQAVLPYEPYYKLKSSLLKMAVEQEQLPDDTMLNVLLFADAHQSTLDALKELGAEIVSEDRSPFGPQVKVRLPASADMPAGQSSTTLLSAVARLPGVQELEPARQRRAANDLSRFRLGVATDSVVSS